MRRVAELYGAENNHYQNVIGGYQILNGKHRSYDIYFIMRRDIGLRMRTLSQTHSISV